MLFLILFTKKKKKDQFIEQMNAKFVASIVSKAVETGAKAIAKGWFS